MTPGAIAKRNADATERMRNAAAQLAGRFGVDAGVLNVSAVGGPEVRALREREGVAELLEQIETRCVMQDAARAAAEPVKRKAS